MVDPYGVMPRAGATSSKRRARAELMLCPIENCAFTGSSAFADDDNAENEAFRGKILDAVQRCGPGNTPAGC